MTSFHPRDLIGRIYVGDRYTLLYILITKCISCGLHGFIEDFFMLINYKFMEIIDPRLDPRGLIGRIYVVEY